MTTLSPEVCLENTWEQVHVPKFQCFSGLLGCPTVFQGRQLSLPLLTFYKEHHFSGRAGAPACHRARSCLVFSSSSLFLGLALVLHLSGCLGAYVGPHRTDFFLQPLPAFLSASVFFFFSCDLSHANHSRGNFSVDRRWKAARGWQEARWAGQ